MKVNNVTNSNRHTKRVSKVFLSKKPGFIRGHWGKWGNCKKPRKGRSSSTGHITSWSRGGGPRKKYNATEVRTPNVQIILMHTSYDPYRSSFVSTGFDPSRKVFVRVLAVDKVVPGSLVKLSNQSNSLKTLKLGYRTLLSEIPPGTLINQVSSRSGVSKFARAAGVKGQLLQKGLVWSSVKLPSGKIIKFSSKSQATIGEISNSQHSLQVLGKAGRSRNLGRRPKVRGVAMNPVDHPHGGKSNGGRLSVSPWGIPTKSGFYLRKKRKNEQI